MQDDDYDAFDDEEYVKSRTQIKNEMLELQALGESLIDLPASTRETLALGPTLQEALVEAKRINHKNAKKRHLNYIGKLMREIDIEVLQAQLNEIKESKHRAAKQLPYVESWMNRLTSDDQDSLNAFIAQCPNTDIQRLRQLIRLTKKEIAEGKKKTQQQKLFKTIQRVMSQA